MSHPHFVKKCAECQTVMAQCRCATPMKALEWSLCDDCIVMGKPEKPKPEKPTYVKGWVEEIECFPNFESGQTRTRVKIHFLDATDITLTYTQGDQRYYFLQEHMREGKPVYLAPNFLLKEEHAHE